MKVYFLTEYSKDIGFGHLSRCSSLADVFIDAGYEVNFFISSWQDEELDLNYEMRGIAWEDDEELKSLIFREDLVIFDSYRVSKSKLNFIARGFDHVISISDSKMNYAEKGVVVIGSVYGKELEVATDKEVEFLAGPEFMLFREDFRKAEKAEIREKAENVLINLGGNADQEVLKTVVSVLACRYKNIEIKILGNTEIQTSSEVKYLGFLDSPDLLREYKKADLVITNGGQSLNEVILLGIPAVGISVADNQNRNIASWHKSGVLKNNIKLNSSCFVEDLEDSLVDMRDTGKRMERVARGNEVIDSHGPVRVLEYVENKWKKGTRGSNG